MSTWLRRYLDGEDGPGDLDVIGPDAVEPCPACGARSVKPGYHGHGMHCQRFYVGEAAGA